MSISRIRVSETAPFSIRVLDHSGAPSVDSKITVYNGWDEVQAEGTGSVQIDVPKGIYTVRVERAGVLDEHVFKHIDGTNKEIREPLRHSSMPTFDTSGTHEYYAYNSMQWSLQDTRPPIGDGAGHDSRLFIFVRMLNASFFKGQDLMQDLFLLDADGMVQSSFQPQEIQQETDGWAALSVQARPGLYLLSYHGQVPREIPLYIFDGRNTQVFITFNERISLETASIILTRTHETFDPTDRNMKTTDAALSGLQRDEFDWDNEIVKELLYGKFDNPMLGLLGGYALFRRSKFDASTLDIVLGNLSYLLPDSPDVHALELLRAEKHGHPLPDYAFDRPPMLRIGLEAVLRLSAFYPHLVPEGSLTDRLSTRLFVDSPWSSWEPVFTYLMDPDGSESAVRKPDTGSKFEARSPYEDPDWITTYLEDLVRNRRFKEEKLDLPRMAQSLGVPLRVLERNYSSIDVSQTSGPEDDLKEIEGIGSTFETVLKKMGYRTFDQLAGADEEDRKRISSRLGRYGSRLKHDKWIEQARDLSSKRK